MRQIFIIGGGPAGLTCAIHAKNKKNRVVILEKNPKPLKKLLVTGNGKCNYFNENFSSSHYHSENMPLVHSFIKEQNLQDVRDFFDSLGIVPKIRNGYYYPFSNQATTIQNVLIEEALSRGVEILCHQCVTSVTKKKNQFHILCGEEEYFADAVVLATGSCAAPKTGSDGFGYSVLKEFGHTLIKPLPALVPLLADHPFLKDWDGVRTDVVLALFEDDKFVSSEEGEAQLTSYGISGICSFHLSHFIVRGLEKGMKEEIHINFVPFITQSITPWMDQYAKKHSHKTIQKLLEGFLNYKIVSVILKTISMDGNRYYQDLSNDEKLELCQYLRGFPLTIVGTKDFESCQVCNGGVKLKEIDMKTMESKIVPGLYVIGELLDINGNCGGYNLTVCWISGILSGRKLGDWND